MRVRSPLVFLMLSACAVSMGGAGGSRAGPTRRSCAFSAVAFTWHDRDRDGSLSEGEEPLRGVQVHLDQLDRGGPYTAGPGGTGSTDRDGYAFFSVFLPGCPPVRFQIRASAPRGYEPTTPTELPTVSGETVRFGFVRRGA